jgi:predicted RNA-binding Zn ribbon-like protein
MGIIHRQSRDVWRYRVASASAPFEICDLWSGGFTGAIGNTSADAAPADYRHIRSVNVQECPTDPPQRLRDIPRDTRTVREAIYLIFAAVAADRQPDALGLDSLNIALSAALSQAKVVVAPAGFAWTWERREGALDQVLWPICRSALELLTSGDVHRVKHCGRHGGCGWLFVDASKNGSRRWCSMQVCDRQEKVRRRQVRAMGNNRRST